ncbi:hypothetical protein KAR91_73310 [Candidatus Pacearchaeota archaeon]|nr:hypothetical protein [Candidatus Pacearchaeota archaeon]
MEQIKGIKSFLKKAVENKGKKYNEDQATELIKSHNYDYDQIINKVGAGAGIGEDKMQSFRERAYKQYGFSPIDETNLAEINFLSAPREFTEDISGYDRYKQLQEDKTLAEGLISGLQSKGKTVETPIAYTGPVMPTQPQKPITKTETVFEPDIQARITDIQSRADEIDRLMAEQAKFNIKESGYVSEEHKLTADKFKDYSQQLEEARKTMIEKSSRESGEFYGTPGMPRIIFRPQDRQRLNDLQDIKSLYKKIGKVMAAPQGKDAGAQLEGLFYGLTQSNTARDFFTFGINEMTRSLNVKAAFDNYQEALEKSGGNLKGIDEDSRNVAKEEAFNMLPKEEQALLETYQLLLNTQAASKANFMANVGEGLQEMIPFIAEFAATSGTATAAKQVVKKFIQNKVKSSAAAKLAGGIAKVGTQAAIMPYTAKGYAERVAPTIGGGGELVEGESPIEAATKAYLTTVAEVAGEDFGALTQQFTRNKAIKALANNPTKSQELLSKLTLRMAAETGVPTIQTGVFELLGEEATGIMQAAIDNEGAFFTPEAQKQLLVTILLAQGGAASFSVPLRSNTKNNYNKSVELLNDIPNADYTKAVENAARNYTDPEQLINAFNEVSKEYNVSEEDYYKARNFVGNSIRYNQMNTTRNIQMEKGISEFSDKNGNITTAEIDGQKWYIRNPEEIETGGVIFAKDQNGNVKPFNASRVTDYFTQTPDEIKNDANAEADLQDQEFDNYENIQQQAQEKGIEIERTVETPHGKGTVISINPDNTVTVQNPKGEQSNVNIDEVEPYLTQEQKDEKKAEEKEPQIISDNSQKLPDGSEIRVVNFDNGQAKLITAEGEQDFDSTEDLEAALKPLLEEQMQASIDQLTPEDRYNELLSEDEEIASEILKDDINGIRTQAQELRTTETISKSEKVENLKQAKILEAEAQRLESVLSAPKEQNLINQAETLYQEFQQEKENTPYNQLNEWQREILGESFSTDQFSNFKDKTEITQSLAKAWLKTDGRPIDTWVAAWNQGIEEGQYGGQQITVEDVVNFITENPTKSFRKTTGRMGEIRDEYRVLTGKTINKHEAFVKESGLTPEKTIPEAKTEQEVIYDEAITKLKDIGYTDEQIAQLNKEPGGVTAETLLEAPLKDVPFRAEEQPTSFLNITEQAQADLKQRQNAHNALNKISNELKQPANIINSSEIPEGIKQAERKLAKGKEGVAFVYNNEMYIVSDRIKSVADAKKSYIHELIVHKGLRDTFKEGEQTIMGKQYAKFKDLMNDVYNSMDDADKLDVISKYLPGVELSEVNDAQIELIAEEYLAHLSELETIPSKWQEFINRLTHLIRKTFGLTSKQFTQTDLVNILRDQRIKLTESADILESKAELLTKTKIAPTDIQAVKETKTAESLQKEKPTPLSDLQKRELEAEIKEEKVYFRVGELTPDRDYLFDSGLIDPEKLKTKEEIAEYNARVEIMNKLYEEGFLGEDFVNDLEEEWVLSQIGENRYFEEIVEEKLDELDQLEQDDLDSGEEKVEDFLDSTNIPVEISIEELAVQSKGLTDYLEEAGYILEDGRLLDFSGKRMGGPGGERVEDHRQLAIPYKESIQSPTDAMNAFMRTTGAIRIDYNGGAIDIETRPTPSQERKIGKIIRDNKGTWTIDLQDGDRKLSLEGGPMQLALDNIERFFVDKTMGTGYADVIRFRVAENKQEIDEFIKDSDIKEKVYHGTRSAFDEFELEQVGREGDFGQIGKGFYFTTDEQNAEAYARSSETEGDPRVIDTYLSIKNLYEWKKPIDSTKMLTQKQANKITSDLKAKGFDGIKYDTGYGFDWYVVFEPNQILIDKSDDIRFRQQQAREEAEIFYSPTEKALANIQQEKGTAGQFKQMLLKNGAKQAELDWMGFKDQFPSVNTKVTKADIQEWIDQNKVEVEEVTKGKLQKTKEDVQNVEWDGDGMGQYIVTFMDATIVNVPGATSYDEDSAIQEALRIENETYDTDKTTTKYSQYQLPGGENYKEVLLTILSKDDNRFIDFVTNPEEGMIQAIDSRTGDVIAEDVHDVPLWETLNELGYNKSQTIDEGKSYKSSHFIEPNILAHIRFNERTDSEGNKVLFIEEIQSDWAQEGRKKGFREGYKKDKLVKGDDSFRTERDKEIFHIIDYIGESGQVEQSFQIPKSRHKTFEDAVNYISSEKFKDTEAVPQMPFKKTDQWINLGLRRMIRYAAENGFDKVAWTTGEQQAERYDLSKQVNEVRSTKLNNGKYDVLVIDKNGKDINLGELTESQLTDNIGKELAEKIVNDSKTKQANSYSGLDLKVGGEGMKSFYNQMIPKLAGKLGRKFGSRVEPVSLDSGKGRRTPGIFNTNMEAIQFIQDEHLEHFEPIIREEPRYNGFSIRKADGSTITLEDIKGPEVLSLPITTQMKETALEEGMPMFRAVQKARQETDTDPSDAQIEAGNYKMGHVKIDGFDISIENPKGSIRSGVNQEGEEWSNKMPADYGYFKGTVGKDKDHIDVFIGENPESDKIYVIDQIDPRTGKFDEHKVMLGFDNVSQARNTYNAAYDKDWKGLGEISRTDKDGLKEWFEGDTKKPYSGPDIRFRIQSESEDIQNLLSRLNVLQRASRVSTRLKELKQDEEEAMVFDRQQIKNQIKSFKEGVRKGTADTKERIQFLQNELTKYANKNMPYFAAGQKDFKAIMTLLKNTQTPKGFEKAIDKIDELSGKAYTTIEKDKNLRAIKRVMDWMTTFKTKGQGKAGKFVYEDVKEFLELKKTDKEAIRLVTIANSNRSTDKQKKDARNDVEKLWQDINNKPDKNILDETMLKIIELRRNGAKASKELIQTIRDDLQTIYDNAKDSKTKEDVTKAINRRDDRDFVKQFLEGTPLKKKKLPGKAIAQLNNFLSDSMGNWETILTMLGGYKMRDKFSFIVNQVNQEVGTQEAFNNVMEIAKNGYGFTSKGELQNHLRELKKKKYQIVKPIREGDRGAGSEIELSKMHIIDIFNAVKNEDIRRDMYMSYGDIFRNPDGTANDILQMAKGKERVDELISKLDPGDIVFADAMREAADSYYDKINEVFIKTFNRDLPKMDNYWPSSAEHGSENDAFANFAQDSLHPSATKGRLGRRTPKIVDAFEKFSNHIKAGEWYSNMALPVTRMNDLFKNANVKDLVSDVMGEEFYRLIIEHIQEQGLTPPSKINKLTKVEKGADWLLNNWVAAAIGLTPSVPVKQLLSVVNYSENMPMDKWAKDFVKAVANPVATWKEMMEIPYLKSRVGAGYSEAVQHAMNTQGGIPKATTIHQAIKNTATLGTRYGDIAAIVFGGKPYLDYLVNEIGMSYEKAVDQFILDTLRSQQSPFSSTLSKFQNSKNPAKRALFAFSNTPSQYMRKMVEAHHAHIRGDITTKQLAKVYTIYAGLNNISYVVVGALMVALMKGGDPWDDIEKKVLLQTGVSAVGGLPFIKDVADLLVRTLTDQDIYDDVNPILEGVTVTIDEVNKALRSDDDDKSKKHLWTATKYLMQTFGVSGRNIEKIYKATFKRSETMGKSNVKETDTALKEQSKPKSKIDKELEGMSRFYSNTRKKQPDYKEAEAAHELKYAYSSAKSKATRLEKDGEPQKAERLRQLVENSKIDLSDTDYSWQDIQLELKRFERMEKIITR